MHLLMSTSWGNSTRPDRQRGTYGTRYISNYQVFGNLRYIWFWSTSLMLLSCEIGHTYWSFWRQTRVERSMQSVHVLTSLHYSVCSMVIYSNTASHLDVQIPPPSHPAIQKSWAWKSGPTIDGRWVAGDQLVTGWWAGNWFRKFLYLKCLIRFKDILQVYKYFKYFYSVNFIAYLKY